MTSLWKLASATILVSSFTFLGCDAPSTGPEGADLSDTGAVDMAPAGPPDLTRPQTGDAIQADKGKWTWVDFPDSTCNEGTPTGIGVNLTDSKNVLVFMMGGGACWDYLTCFVLNTAAKGPITKSQFDKAIGGAGGSVLDRAADTPFKDWNLVFVPYCTGDVHAGDNDVEYTSGNLKQTWRHKGRANLVAFLKRLGPTFPQVDKLVVSGSSAGGYGASLNYDLVRSYFPDAKQSYMLDDCGPALVGDDIAMDLRGAWFTNWKIKDAIGDLCPDCADDMSKMVPALSAKYPKDRLALLGFTQDQTIRSFFRLSAVDFEAAMNKLATQVLDPTPNGRYFFIKSASHTMLGNVAAHTANGVKLTDWLKQDIGDEPTWKSIKP